MDIVIAGGVESMTGSPLFSKVGDVKSSSRLTEQYNIVNQGISAELMAEKWGVSREKLDQYALKSHLLAQKAIENGYYQKEITPISVQTEEGNTRVVDTDEGPRSDTSLEALAQLNPVFKEDGKITAGNASQMSDGASAVLLMSKKKRSELGLKPKAKIIASNVVRSDHTFMFNEPQA